MPIESKSGNAIWEKFAHTLLATTCLTVGASGLSSAATILIVEGISPAPADFPNITPGYALPGATNEVQGTLHGTTDTADWFEFQGLGAGTSFTLLGKYSPLHQEKGVSYSVFDSSSNVIGTATLEGQGRSVIGTVPQDGNLIVDVHFAQAGSPTYQFDLTAQTPEPAPWVGTALGLVGTLAWRRKRRKELT